MSKMKFDNTVHDENFDNQKSFAKYGGLRGQEGYYDTFLNPEKAKRERGQVLSLKDAEFIKNDDMLLKLERQKKEKMRNTLS